MFCGEKSNQEKIQVNKFGNFIYVNHLCKIKPEIIMYFYPFDFILSCFAFLHLSGIFSSTHFWTGWKSLGTAASCNGSYLTFRTCKWVHWWMVNDWPSPTRFRGKPKAYSSSDMAVIPVTTSEDDFISNSCLLRWNFAIPLSSVV